ncbi:AAA family ATPase [Corynebacterium guangdongense]|uniref:ATPase n=1 Tax=Corynebacterium guangdongense TaxID=1783348 RepID=A0ABU2A102_9CORY|nr:AAA family ATPase [Corynebacterium guangdongense]MDR7329808.1 putative ATPase [Corynebacterium guangdongense]WJZ18371.1 recombination protein F [Corynebacterium guangdongense]
MIVSALRLPELRAMAAAGVESYVLDLPAVRHLARTGPLRLSTPVTVLVGDNGAGKSTLLEALALALGFPGMGGPVGGFHGDMWAARTGTESRLAHHLVVRTSAPLLRGFFLRAETSFQLLTEADRPPARAGRNVLASGQSLHARSHGESVLGLVAEHVAGAGLYLFDEPEAGLSTVRQMALLAEIDQAVDRGAQFIIATHSPVLPALPRAEILEVNEAGILPVAYDDVESVRAMREFLDDPRGVVDYLTRPE